MQLQTAINHLFSTQQEEWEQLETGIRQFGKTRVKILSWGDQFSVNVQFNPARKVSTTAKIDPASLQAAPCFLCEPNRPLLQKGVPFLDKYIILCNPFPILENHLTVPLHSHVPQRIRKKIADMLTLAEQLPDYVIFYNGPKSGASAPHHFHFQAGLKNPVLVQGDNELRSCLVIESENKPEAEELFEDVFYYLRERQPGEEEPMMNVIAFMEQDRYHVHVFPRKAHRPSCYYEEGSRKMLVSPGALDMAGCIITVREEDFNKIEKQHVEEIYAEVSLPVI